MKSATTTFEISPQHPALPGHFPVTPIVPGAVLLDEALRAIEAAHGASIASCTIAWAKFRSIARPAEPLVLHHEQRADGSIMFVIRTSLRVVADGVVTLSFASGEASPHGA